MQSTSCEMPVWINHELKSLLLGEISIYQYHICRCHSNGRQWRRTEELLDEGKSSVRFISVAQSCLILCDPMDCSMPGPLVHHQLPEFTQTHANWVGDAIQQSDPLLSPSPPNFNLSQHQDLFQWVSSLHQVAKVLELPFQHQSCRWIFRTDFLQDWLVWLPCSLRDSQESSPTSQFKSINSSALSFLHSPTLTYIHDPWKNHSLD